MNSIRRDSVNEVTFKPIGIIHSPFQEPRGTPIQPTGAQDIVGTVEIAPEYVGGLKDIEGFSHIILIYYFHLSRGYLLEIEPYMDEKSHGIFATRAPTRPNPIGISIVRLVKVESSVLHIRDVDIVDGTPLLDIKPYVPEFDTRKVEKIGWLKRKTDRLSKTRDDGRFT